MVNPIICLSGEFKDICSNTHYGIINFINNVLLYVLLLKYYCVLLIKCYWVLLIKYHSIIISVYKIFRQMLNICCLF